MANFIRLLLNSASHSGSKHKLRVQISAFFTVNFVYNICLDFRYVCTLIAQYCISGYFILIVYSYPYFWPEKYTQNSGTRMLITCCLTFVRVDILELLLVHQSNLNKLVEKATLNSSQSSIFTSRAAAWS